MKYLILNLDGKPDNNGEYFEDCDVMHSDESLPIYLFFRKETEFVVGTATVSVENGKVYAELEFFTDDQIQLALYNELAPCVGGVTLSRDPDDAEHVTKIELKSIGLDILNSDSRIRSLKGQRNVKSNN